MGDGVMSVNINMNLETAALPVFRLMGMAIPICLSREADDMELAWERWHESSLKDTLPAFSKSVYVLRHLYHSTGYILIIGYLVSNDAPLPEGANGMSRHRFIRWQPCPKHRAMQLRQLGNN